MSTGSNPLYTRAVLATAALTGQCFANAAGTVPAAAARAAGVARSDAAIGQYCPVDMIGTTTVTAGGAIAVDALVEVGAGGVAVTHNAGVPVGRALEAATAAGDSIEIQLIPN